MRTVDQYIGGDGRSTLPKCYGRMGFRDIKQFNMVMLGKQGWRLMTSSNSLCARVIKGKYNPNGDFLMAKKKRNSSHTWRALLTGRRTLQCGLICRIGDGESTNIWQDCWIPRAFSGKPICPKPRASVVHVSELLSGDGRSWDEEALDNNLLYMDEEAVK